MTDGRHLTSEEVAAYLDNTLSEAECNRAKAHLADCEVCRAEIVSVSRLVDRAPGPRRRYIGVSAVAAAAVIVIFVARPSADSDLPSEPLRGQMSSATSEGVAAMRAIAPIGQQTTTDALLFAWHPAAPGAVYRLTLTSDRGAKVWVQSTNDTTLAIPRNIPLLPGGSYHWYVDATLPDGGAVTTGVTSFEVLR